LTQAEIAEIAIVTR